MPKKRNWHQEPALEEQPALDVAQEPEQVLEPEPVREAEAPRSRYEDIALDQEDDSVYLPPRIDLESMSKDQIESLSVRYLGRRPDARATKEMQIDEVRRVIRGGLPGYGR